MLSYKTKIFALVSLILILASISTAAEIDFSGKDSEALQDRTVWLKQTTEGTAAKLSCESGYNVTSVKVSDQELIDKNTSEYKLGLKEIRNKINNTGQHDLVLTCDSDNPNNSKSSASATILAEKIDDDETKITQDGKGFVDGSLSGGALGNSKPVKIKVEIDKKSRDIEEVFDSSADTFQFEGDDFQLSKDDVEIVDEDSFSLVYELTPDVRNYVDSKTELKVYDKDGNLAKKFTDWKPHVYEYNYEVLSGPERRIGFETVMDEKYRYNLDVGRSAGEMGNLQDDDFLITVKEYRDGGYKDPEFDDLSLSGQDFEKKEWLTWKVPSGSGNYEVFIDNMNYISQLPDGHYRFDIMLDAGSETVTMDRVLVDKGTMFSGRVYDSGGSGVKTNFRLISDNGDTMIESRPDGTYSKEIDAGLFDAAEVDFHHTGRDTYDTRVFLNDPKLDQETDLAGEGSAVRYHYWSDPTSNVPGVETVNQMALMFGYDMSEPQSVKMKFDPSEINPQELQVYECSFWNFEGKKCDGEWNQIDRTKFDVNLVRSPPEVKIDDVERFDNPGDDKKILMNSYVLGVPAGVRLGDQFTISGPSDGRIPMNGDLTVSGDVIDENDNPIGEGHQVDIEFGEGDVELNPKTDSDGEFEVEGSAPSEPGDYEITVESNPEGYGSFKRTFDDPLVVYKEKDISLNVPDSVDMRREEEKEIDIEVKNTGQTELTDVSLTFSGMDSSLYSVSSPDLGSIPAGESKKSTVTVEIPDAYSDAFPSLISSVSAKAGEEQLEGEQEIQFQAQESSVGNQESDNASDNESDPSESQNVDNEGSGFSMPSPSLGNVTGQFMEDKSTLNMALGFLTLFLMVVAVAVKKDKNSDRGSRGSGMRDRPVSGGTGAATQLNVSPSETGGEDEYVCDETGEVFDTKEGLELYKEMQGIE